MARAVMVSSSAVHGAAELRAKLRQIGDEADEIMTAGLVAGGEVVRTQAIVNATSGGASGLKRVSGTLVRSLSVQRARTKRPAVDVGTNLEYAAIHEFGGVIRSKNADKLTFQIDGQWISTDEVTIPARPYLRPALDDRKTEAFGTAGRVAGLIIAQRYRIGA